MSEKRFVCIDVDYGDDWYITDNGKRLSEIEIVDLLNEMSEKLGKKEKSVKLFFKFKELENENEQLRKNFDDIVQWASEIAKRNVILDEKIGKLQKELQKQ